MRTIGHISRNFDAAIDGAGRENEDLVLGGGKSLAVHGVEQCVLVDRGERPRGLSLELNPQEVQHIAAGQDRVEIVMDFDPEAQLLPTSADERAWATEQNLGTEFGQAPDVAPRGPTVSDIAHKRDRESSDAAEAFADGEDVQKALRGMLVRAVASVDDRARQRLAQQVGGTRRAMPNDHRIHAHRLDGFGRVDERLALAQAAAAGRKVHGIGTQPACSERKAVLGPRAILEEQVRRGPTGQQTDLLTATAGGCLEQSRGIEKGGDLVGRKLFEPQQMIP